MKAAKVSLISLLFPLTLCIMGHFDSAAAQGLSAEDRIAIETLMAQYGRAYDDRDADAWAAVFLPDAPMLTYVAGKLSLELKSNPERRNFAQSRFAAFEKDGVSQTRHYLTNSLLRALEDGSVEGSTMFFVTFQYASETTPRLIHTGLYRDRFVRAAEGWKFAKRKVYIDHK